MNRHPTRSALRGIGPLALVLALAAACGSNGSSGGGTGGAGGGAGGPGSGGSAAFADGGVVSVDASVEAGADAPLETLGPTSSGVAPAKMLGDLTADEKQKLCDFRAARYGGYGMAIDCGNGTTVSADDNLAACLGPDDLGADCAKATVGDFEACANDTTCDEPQPDSCQPLLLCN